VKYINQLTKLRDELTTIKRETPACVLELYDLDGDYAIEGPSYSGSDFAHCVRLPREAASIEEWFKSL
jgi:hypothetical protein